MTFSANPAPVTSSAQAGIDPITLEVIRHGLISAASQVDANITRTAFSPFIYEYKDYAVGLVDPAGQLIAQNTGAMPIFVGATGEALTKLREITRPPR